MKEVIGLKDWSDWGEAWQHGQLCIEQRTHSLMTSIPVKYKSILYTIHITQSILTSYKGWSTHFSIVFPRFSKDLCFAKLFSGALLALLRPCLATPPAQLPAQHGAGAAGHALGQAADEFREAVPIDWGCIIYIYYIYILYIYIYYIYIYIIYYIWYI